METEVVDRTFFDQLLPRWQKVIDMREDGFTYGDIAKELGVSSVRVQQIESLAKYKLISLQQRAEVETKLTEGIELTEKEEATIRFYYKLNPTNSQKVIAKMLRASGWEYCFRKSALEKMSLLRHLGV